MNNYEDCYIDKTYEQQDINKKIETIKSIVTDFPRINRNRSSIMWFCKK
jgi:hypothetical protein